MNARPDLLTIRAGTHRFHVGLDGVAARGEMDMFHNLFVAIGSMVALVSV